MEEERICLLCKTRLEPAGFVGQAEDLNKVDGFCPLCNIYYEGDEAKFVMKGNQIIKI